MEPMENGPVWDADRTWTAVHAERARLAANLEHLSPKQWRTASLCTEWTVEETLAHLTAGASTGRLAWLRSMVSARFDAGRHNARRLRELGAGGVEVAGNLKFDAEPDPALVDAPSEALPMDLPCDRSSIRSEA